jgi:serine phosphatase RsbU (regulator of sigma subunit)
MVDICGHGVPAAMVSGMIKSAFHASHDGGYRPLDVVQRVADVLQRAGHRRFVTLFCGRIDSHAGVLEYASAGHPPGLLRRADGSVERLSSTGTIICADLPEQHWTQESTPFRRGDQVLLYTDGVTESEGPGGMLGIHGLTELAARSTARDGALLVEILQYAHDHAAGSPGFDDQTLMVAGIP